ncbi:MAG: glycosyltransferase family 1 protein [Patescibacteria group bacterium]
MIIGIDASRANQDFKTGTEWYSYYLIQNLALIDQENQYILYTKEPAKEGLINLGKNFKNKVLKWPPNLMWSQLRLSMEMIFNRPDVLFVPAHTIPIIHPKKTVTTCHDVGFERYPELYATKAIGPKKGPLKAILNLFIKIISFGRFSGHELDYHRFSMRFAVKHAWKIITPSNFTKSEIKHYYPFAKENIYSVYSGINHKNYNSARDDRRIQEVMNKYGLKTPFFVFIGRLEEKKNIVGLLEVFNMFIKEYKTDHQLVLIGQPGYGYEKAKNYIVKNNIQDKVKEIGWISEEEVASIYKSAEALIFLSFYEGLGLPPLEAQACGLPVLASDRGSLPEILQNTALITDPSDFKGATKKLHQITADERIKKEHIDQGLGHVKDFSWINCAKKTRHILTS